MLNYMVIHAPDDFPPEGGMNLNLAFVTIEYGFKQLEEKDGRPAILDSVRCMRSELAVARELFGKSEVVPACHKLQDVEDILKGLKVKQEVR